MKKILTILAFALPVFAFGQDTILVKGGYQVKGDLENAYQKNVTLLDGYADILSGSTIAAPTGMTRGIVKIRIAGFGDSMGDKLAIPIYNRLNGQYGNGGGPFSAPSLTGGASIHNNVSENTYWPTGIWYEINSTGTLTFLSSGSRMTCDQIKIYYIMESGAGSFQVALDSAGAGYVNEGSVVNTANATTQAGIITINKGYADYGVRISQVSGNVKIINVYGFSRFKDGVSYIPVNNPGLNWVNANSTSRAITNPVFADLGINFAILQFKENGSIYSTIKSFLTDYKAISRRTKWILVGSPPNADIGGYTNANNIADNKSLRRIAQEDTMLFFDAHTQFNNFQTIVDAGMAGDSIHLADPIWIYLGSQLNRILGLDDLPFARPYFGSDIDQSPIINDNRKLKFKTRGVDYGGMGLGAAGIYWRSITAHNISDTSGNIQAYWSNAGNGFMIQTNQSSNGYGWNTSGQPGYYYNGSDHQVMLNKGSNVRGNLQMAIGKANAAFVVSSGFAAGTNASVGFEINSTTKAYLLSRMTSTQRDALTGVNGMLVYNTTDASMDVRDASAWQRVMMAKDSANLFTSKASRDKLKDSLLAIMPTAGYYIPTVIESPNFFDNITTVTADSSYWQRVGNIVSVEVSFTAVVNAASTITGIQFTLPIASAFTSKKDATGGGQWDFGTISSTLGVLTTDIVNDKIDLSFTTSASHVTDTEYKVKAHFKYIVK